MNQQNKKTASSNTPMLNHKTKNMILFGGAVAASYFVDVPSTLAQNTPVDLLKTEVDKLPTIYTLLVPTVIGAAVFAMGMALVKRIVYA